MMRVRGFASNLSRELDVTRGQTESKLAFSSALGARRGETVALIRHTDALEARDRVAVHLCSFYEVVNLAVGKTLGIHPQSLSNRLSLHNWRRDSPGARSGTYTIPVEPAQA